MRIYVGFDDTDNIGSDRGTGKLARWFEDSLPENCNMWGVVRQQLLISDSIPYTSHNSSACVVIDAPDNFPLENIISKAVDHVEQYSLNGSDPGICVASERDTSLPQLIAFGRQCTAEVVTQKQALRTSSNVHLSGHGGTNDGIIGAAAAVGLTASGWCGRFIEYGRLRDFPERVRVSELEQAGILVVSVDRDAMVPAPEDIVLTKSWLRPRFWGKRAVLNVIHKRNGIWESMGEKRHKVKSGKKS